MGTEDCRDEGPLPWRRGFVRGWVPNLGVRGGPSFGKSVPNAPDSPQPAPVPPALLGRRRPRSEIRQRGAF